MSWKNSWLQFHDVDDKKTFSTKVRNFIRPKRTHPIQSCRIRQPKHILPISYHPARLSKSINEHTMLWHIKPITIPWSSLYPQWDPGTISGSVSPYYRIFFLWQTNTFRTLNVEQKQYTPPWIPECTVTCCLVKGENCNMSILSKNKSQSTGAREKGISGLCCE